MSGKENLRNIFKTRNVKEMEEIENQNNAQDREDRATTMYLEGEISLEEYHRQLQETFPQTEIDFRKLASEIKRNR